MITPGLRLRSLGRNVAFLVGLGAVVLAVYRPHLSDPLDSDARFLTVQNAYVRGADGIGKVWTADFFEGAVTNGVPYRSGYYRPVTNALFWLEYRVIGESSVGYHITQLLLHALNAFLFYALVVRLFGDRRAGVVGALLFALHPVHAFAASQPAARADVLFPTFYLLGIWLFDSALADTDRTRGVVKVGLTAVCYCLAVLSKEMGITLPAALAIIVCYRHFREQLPIRRLVWTAPIFGLTAVYVIWRFVVLDIASPEVGYTEVHGPLPLFLGGLRSLTIHSSRVLFPFGPTYPELNPSLLNLVASPFSMPLTYVSIAVASVIGLGAFGWKQRPSVAFLCGLLIITFSPLMKVDSIAGSLGSNVILTQERWFYLPSVALIAFVALGVSSAWDRLRAAKNKQMVLAGVVVVVLCGLAFSSNLHAGRHDDPFAQLRRLYLHPDERLSRMERANKLMLYAQWVALPSGDEDEAERRARAAVDIVPDSPISAVALGYVLLERQKWSEVVRVVEPWMNPTRDAMLRHSETNPRVGDDLNRVSSRIPFLLATAYAYSGEVDRAPELFCAAAQRGFDLQLIRSTWRSAFNDRQFTCEITMVG